MSALDEALEAFAAQAPRLIKERENAVYEVRQGQAKAALRLHRPGYQSAAAIHSEIDWMLALAQAGMRVPEPLAAADGRHVVALSGGRLATLVRWVEGRPLGEGGQRLSGPPEEQERHFTAIGREVARLHNLTDGLDLPGTFTRHRWDIEGFLGEEPFWGRFWESPVLSEAERGLILRARKRARADLEAFGRDADFGLIHADVLRENVLIDADGAVTLIDYDDAGWGFRLYDLATLMSQNEDEPASLALRAAALAGYRSERPLSARDAAHLDLFILLRRFASMGWVVPRSDDPATLRLYGERALRAAWHYMDAL